MGFPDDALTRDSFLGGRVQILQPRKGYRAGSDPVFLAAACTARPGESVLELGCGAGTASLCLAARVPELSLVGVERQADYAELAQRNAAANGANLEVVTADLAALPPALRRRSFDHVILNPPFHAPGDGSPADDPGRETALREETPLALWLEVAARRLAPKGWVTVIQAADRLADLLKELPGVLGSVSVLPLSARAGRPAGRVLLRARKGGRAPFRLLAPLVLHDGAAHLRDADDHSEAASAILRDARPVQWDAP